MDRRLFLKGLGVGGALFGTVTTFDAFAKSSRNKVDIDVIVIGSGPAGLALADKLSSSGVTVAVLETGGYKRDSQRQSLAEISKVNPPPFDVSLASQRIVGGSSLLWGGYCPRYSEMDLVSKSKFGYGVDWPIDFHDLNRYYCEAENWLQVGTAKDFSDCKNSLSSPFTASAQKWQSAFQPTSIRKVIPASACTNQQGEYEPMRLIRDRAPKLRRRRNLILFIDTTVRRIEFDKSGLATGVHVSRINGQQGFIKAKTVVIAGGAIQNARLLQLSSDTVFPAGAGNGGGHLGANFMEHPHIRFWLKPAKKWQQLPPSVLHLYNWYDKNKDKGLGSLMVLLDRFDEKPGWVKNKPDSNLLIDVLCEQEPRAENIVTLDKYNKDLFGDPLPNLAYSFSKRDQQTMDKTENSIQDLLHILGGDVKKDTGDFGAHLMGTTRMAKNENQGVVDSNQRVFGTRNVYISGASVFPTGGAANPTLTLTALSLRLGDHLLQQSKSYNLNKHHRFIR